MKLRLSAMARLVLLAVGLLLALAACDSDDPTTPTPPDIVDINSDGYDDRDMDEIRTLLRETG